MHNTREKPSLSQHRKFQLNKVCHLLLFSSPSPENGQILDQEGSEKGKELHPWETPRSHLDHAWKTCSDWLRFEQYFGLQDVPTKVQDSVVLYFYTFFYFSMQYKWENQQKPGRAYTILRNLKDNGKIVLQSWSMLEKFLKALPW